MILSKLSNVLEGPSVVQRSMIGQVDLEVLTVRWRGRGGLDHVLVGGHQVVRQRELMLQPRGGHLTGHRRSGIMMEIQGDNLNHRRISSETLDIFYQSILINT